jgi:hypothetical protein
MGALPPQRETRTATQAHRAKLRYNRKICETYLLPQPAKISKDIRLALAARSPMKTIAHMPPAWARTFATLTAVAIAAMLTSCAHLNPPEPEPAPEPTVAEKKAPPKPIKPPPPSSLYEWWGKDYVSHIEVSINEQKARFYSGDQMVGWTTVASGVHKFPTPTGSFAVTEKIQDKKSNLYGKIYNKNGKLVKRNAKMGVHRVPAGGRFKGAPMPYFLRLTNDGIGMHAGPIPRPGSRASHGCIRMPRNFAPILYRHVDIGTAVTIKGNGPAYASYVTKQRKSAPKPASTAVAKTDPTPASTTVETVGASTTAAGAAAPGPGMAAAPPQPPADATPSSTSTAALAPPATGMVGVPGPTSAQEPPPPSPATTITTVTPGMAGVPIYHPTSTAPTSPSLEVQAAPAPGMAGVPPTSAGNPAPAPAPASSAPEPIPPQAPPSMTGVSSAPAQSMGQTAPVESTPPPPAAAAPPVQSEG